jgi:hypothetical protein
MELTTYASDGKPNLPSGLTLFLFLHSSFQTVFWPSGSFADPGTVEPDPGLNIQAPFESTGA